jgi:hypothetical protein
MSEVLPAYDIANRLVLNVDFEKLVETLKELLR